MRTYHLAAAALAIEAPAKWLDNLISQHQIPGVRRERRGVSRRISPDGLLHAALVRRLSADVGLPVGRAVVVARELVSADGTLSFDRFALSVDLRDLRQLLELRLREVVETTVPARRGRPPRRRPAPSA